MYNYVYLKLGVGVIFIVIEKKMKLNIIVLGFLILMKIGLKNRKIEMWLLLILVCSKFNIMLMFEL